jgi:hypothetical protein
MQSTMDKTTKKPKAPTRPDAKPAAGALLVLGIEVPYVASTKYAQREIYMSLPIAQAVVLRSVFEGLEERHATLANGKPVQSPQDALRWLLEEAARVARRPA